MADTLEPPAKRARFDEPDPDVPGSPVDDLEDDFYDTTPVKPSPLPAGNESAAAYGLVDASASAGVSSLQLPGLGLPGLAGPAQETSTLQDASKDEDLEEGELSDSASLYNDLQSVQAAAPAVEQSQDPGDADMGDADDAALLDAVAIALNADEAAEDGEPWPHMTAAATADSPAASLPTALPASSAPLNDAENAAKPETSDVVATKAEFLRAGEANKDNPQAEWQLDSEASSSSDDSSSDDSSDDSSEDGEEEGSDEGELLDPEEQIRRLMEEATSDGPPGKATVRTVNEVEEEYKKPDINMTETTPITILGTVESVVDNLVLIKRNKGG